MDPAAVTIDGRSLTLSDVMQVSRGDVPVAVSEWVWTAVESSVKFLEDYLEKGKTVYGVNTGFGGSAHNRTGQLEDLQKSLMQFLNCGVLSLDHLRENAVSFGDRGNANAMPRTWVRATMLVRLNSLIRGHSGVGSTTIASLQKMLNEDVLPVIPLRGSISASGDLMPLAYIASTLEGNPDVFVSYPTLDGFRVIPSSEAFQRLENLGLKPLRYSAKEVLGLVNGTAVSAAVAALAISQSKTVVKLAQILTAMGTEALLGSTGNYHPFISRTRPHRGQEEVARNILGMLNGAVMTQLLGRHKKSGLCQDRYALRTAPQWLGPYVEDLDLAAEQITIELNSTTDNPLIDMEGGNIHSGGNFQAASVTSAIEKVRLALQIIGKLIFAQCSELLNDQLNNGLPPNLAPDDAETSYPFKGIDISMSAYMSELAFLANPVSSHVQSAEMHNQAVNSLALVSARYTHEALDLVAMMSAAYLMSLCQALDLRAKQVGELGLSNGYVDDDGEPHTVNFLGRASSVMYSFVRDELGVPFHRGLVDHPTIQDADNPRKEKLTIGTNLSKIYEAIASGRLTSTIDECIGE